MELHLLPGGRVTTRHQTLTIAFLLAAASFAAAQTASKGANSSFAGTFNGERNDGAGLDLTIDENGGQLSGSALLYFRIGSALPLLSPQLEGKTLTFEVQ